MTRLSWLALLLTGCHDSTTAPPLDCTQRFFDPIVIFAPDGTHSTITFPIPKPAECPAKK